MVRPLQSADLLGRWHWTSRNQAAPPVTGHPLAKAIITCPSRTPAITSRRLSGSSFSDTIDSESGSVLAGELQFLLFNSRQERQSYRSGDGSLSPVSPFGCLLEPRAKSALRPRRWIHLPLFRRSSLQLACCLSRLQSTTTSASSWLLHRRPPDSTAELSCLLLR